MVIDNTRGEALGMMVRTVEGKNHLLVEVGGFPEEANPEHHSADNLHVRD